LQGFENPVKQPSKDCKDRGRLSGIFDDRGKYIYITIEASCRVAELPLSKAKLQDSAATRSIWKCSHGSPKVSVAAFQRFQKQQTHQNEAPKRSTGDGSSCCLVEEKGPNQSRCPCLGSSKIRENKY